MFSAILARIHRWIVRREAAQPFKGVVHWRCPVCQYLYVGEAVQRSGDVNRYCSVTCADTGDVRIMERRLRDGVAL